MIFQSLTMLTVSLVVDVSWGFATIPDSKLCSSSHKSTLTMLRSAYLDSLQAIDPNVNGAGHGISVSAVSVATTMTATTPTTKATTLTHVALEYFGLDKLVSKGPRPTCDWGTPQEWSREMADDGVLSAGSWYCTEGGWPSPKGKAVTEVFYVLEGHGALGDADGVMHYFGPGDMVIIPKGHTGRWDVYQAIHKIWAVNDHERIEERATPIRVQVDHYKDFTALSGLADTTTSDPLYGSTVPVASASNTFYNTGPTRVGVWTCQRGTFAVQHGVRQWFHMLEGTLFVTNGADGTSRRCVAGDTVILPHGWYGHIDVVEPVKKVWCSGA